MPLPRLRGAVALALGGLLAGLVAGCSTTGQTATNQGGYVPGDGSYLQIPAADRKTAPDLSGPLLDGGDTSLAADHGKVVVLNMWASWCGPCRKEAPALAAADRALPGVVFLGINTRDDADNARAFARATRAPYPSFLDQDGSLILQLQQVISMAAMPTTVVVDKQGRVAAAVYGPTTTTLIEALVRPLERAS